MRCPSGCRTRDSLPCQARARNRSLRLRFASLPDLVLKKIVRDLTRTINKQLQSTASAVCPCMAEDPQTQARCGKSFERTHRGWRVSAPEKLDNKGQGKQPRPSI